MNESRVKGWKCKTPLKKITDQAGSWLLKKSFNLYEKPPLMILAAAKSKSPSSRMIQASLPPSSIWSGIIPAFFEIAIPVSPPVKLNKNTHQVGEDSLSSKNRSNLKIRNAYFIVFTLCTLSLWSRSMP